MNDSVRLKPKTGVLEELAKVAAARHSDGDNESGHGDSEAVERGDPLPRPGDAYTAHARRAAKPEMTLFFVQKDYLPNGYSYANLERVWMVDGKPGTAPVLVVRFYGSVITEVTIEGRDLTPLCNAIGRHLMPWLWEHPSPKDFSDGNETVIRKISFNHMNA